MSVMLISGGLTASAADTNIIGWRWLSSTIETNAPQMPTNVIALAGSDYHCVALLADRTVKAWGRNINGETNVPPDLSNVVGIAAGNINSLAVNADGQVRMWGRMASTMQLAFVPAEATNVVALGVGRGALHSVALRADGTVVNWGWASAPIPAEAFNIVSVAAGSYHALALRSDGRVISWGIHQNPVPASATNIVAIAAGDDTSVAVRADGRLLTWGNISTPSSSFTNIVEVGCFQNGGGIALRGNGTVTGWGAPVTIQATNIMTVGADSWGALAVKAAGPPIFPLPAVRRTVASGQTAYLRHRAVGALPLTYQWSFQGTNLPGATNSTLAITNASLSYTGTYSLVASNSLGVVTSSNMELLVLPTIIESQPLGLATNAGVTVAFRVGALGQGPLSYQWLFNGTNVSWGTNSTLTLTNVQLTDSGTYSVTVSNEFGGTTSANALLSVGPMLITSHPQPTNQAVYVGASTTLSVSVSGQPPLSYQWSLNGTNIVWGTNSTLTLTNIQLADAGSYSVSVSNIYGTISSSNAFVSVWPLLVTAQPQNRSSVAGMSATFGVTAAGQGPFGYQWLFNGAVLAGATTNPVTLSDLQLNQAGEYAAVISNQFGAVTSSPALLKVWPLAIDVQPQNYTALLGAPVRFSVTAVGPEPFSYQWRHNGSDIAGAIDNPLVLTNSRLSQAGDYSVRVANSLGSTNSANARLSLSQVAVWGNNNYGQTNVPAGLTNVTAIAASIFNTFALKADGKIVSWGDASGPAFPSGLSEVIAIAAGNYHTLALKENGTVAAWGSAQTTNVPPGLSNVVAVAGGVYHSIALKADGTVIAWGAGTTNSGTYPNLGQSIVPLDLTNVVSVATKGTVSLALRDDGSIVAWGTNESGQASVPVGFSNALAIAAGFGHTLALQSDGTVFTWGNNDYGQADIPAGLTNVVNIWASLWNSFALTADSRLVVWGDNSNGKTNAPLDLTYPSAVVGGRDHVAVLLEEDPTLQRVPVETPTHNNGVFSVSVPTRSGRVYRLEHKDSLQDSIWIAHTLVAGTGGTVTFADPTATGTQRFYRVRRW